ncbi:MAG: sugar ABC transporter ATP-binding protein [Rhodospirillales bacterium]|nr:sugar ABC transporter ATP-binding protein [Rhodospirillales bacterium]
MLGNDPIIALSARNIDKRFQATKALEDVSVEFVQGAIHTLVGENGAGKSTLIKILCGIYPQDRGTILLDGIECRFEGPGAAAAAGIVVIPQELRVVPAATVAENVTLGQWPSTKLLGALPILDKTRMRAMAAEALERLKVSLPLAARVDSLSFAERQMVVIARALLRKARGLILDEPTASLESREAQRLFELIEGLKAQGVAIIYVSHRLDEVVALSDHCTVLRDGKVVARRARGGIDKDELIRLMTGRDLEELQQPHSREFGPPLLEAERIDGAHSERRLCMRRGEVVGLAGLLGSGTTQFLYRLFGAAGTKTPITVEGRKNEFASPAQAIKAGLGLVPGERALGLVMSLSVRDNIVLPNLDTLGGRWNLDTKGMDRLTKSLIELLDIRPRDPHRLVRELSGGNQQKVIFARWLASKATVLLLDEPTHGIDVAAKARIHRLMREFAAKGGGVLFASSEMVEVVSMSDTLLAMRQGRVVAEMARGAGEFSERALRAYLGG